MRMDSPSLIIPLQTDEHGVIRVSGTRVTLDSIINYYLQGQTPEALHEGFPTVPLTDIYAVIAYYLANRDELDAYLKQQETEAERIRQEFEATYPPKVTRAELLKRREAKQNKQDT
ncbi:MAG: DUF433 domain-containing protein [Chloroflexi bacterium]|nr:DUF433 domain-containing protein [Chloroflexota bacterium]